MAKSVTDPAIQSKIEQLIEAEKKAAHYAGYADRIRDEIFGTQIYAPDSLEPEKAAKPAAENPSSPRPYISKTPADIAKRKTAAYLQSVFPREVGPTEIVKNLGMEGTAISYQGVRRAFDALVREGEAVRVGEKRWRAAYGSGNPTSSNQSLIRDARITPNAKLMEFKR
jgi:hypothetical protein